jgi:hypothetical protein
VLTAVFFEGRAVVKDIESEPDGTEDVDTTLSSVRAPVVVEGDVGLAAEDEVGELSKSGTFHQYIGAKDGTRGHGMMHTNLVLSLIVGVDVWVLPVVACCCSCWVVVSRS